MIKTALLAMMGLGLSALAGGGADAQSSAMKPADGKMMMSGGMMMSKSTSDKDMAAMKMCKAMSHNAMMKDPKCVALQKSYAAAMMKK